MLKPWTRTAEIPSSDDTFFLNGRALETTDFPHGVNPGIWHEPLMKRGPHDSEKLPWDVLGDVLAKMYLTALAIRREILRKPDEKR